MLDIIKPLLKKNNLIVFMLISIIALGALLRLSDLASKSFWGDELLSLWHARDIVDLNTFFNPPQANAHPPFYFILLKLWSLGGEGEAYSRFLAVLFGILLIPATYLLGRQFFDQKASLIGAFLVAISPLHILYDREVRMYPLFVLLSVISLYFFINALRAGKSKMWIGYIVFTILNTYTHYHAFLLILGQWVFFIIRYKQYKHLIPQALASQFAVAVAFAFWLPAFFAHLKSYSVLGAETTRFPTTLGTWIKPLYLFFSFSLGQTVMPWNYIIVIPALIIFFAAFVLGIKNMLKNAETFQFFSIFLFAPVLAGLFISDMMPRYFLFIAPIYTLMVAKGLSTFRPATIQTASVAVITILLAFSLNNYYTNKDFHIMAHVDPWREVGRYLGQNVTEKDIVFNIGGGPINHYTNFDIPILGLNAPRFIKESLRNKDDQSDKIWLILSDPRYKHSGENVIKWLNKHYVLVSEQRYAADPNSLKKKRFFSKDFMEYRIRVLEYR